MQDSIVADLRRSYGLTCHDIEPVAGGWLNRKWKISTGQGDVLVKEFSSQRCSREKLERVECALQRQILLQKDGVPCPAVWPCGGRAIRLLDDEIAYMVMDFCPGRVEGPDTITLAQMHSLGSACARMHGAFSRLPAQSVEGYPVNSADTIDSLWANFRARARACSPDDPVEYQRALPALEPILKRLEKGFFDRLPGGIGHEDFSADNILFDGERVAIVDFDRNHYGYVRHDVGRAMLSFALKDGQLDTGRVAAFLEGYARHLPLTLPDIWDALRLSWCVEVPWWIQPEFFRTDRGKVARFKDEMLWLTEHWSELDSLLTR